MSGKQKISLVLLLSSLVSLPLAVFLVRRQTYLGSRAQLPITPPITIPVTPSPGTIPGDANGDGRVSGQDYLIWVDNYGAFTQNGYPDADFNLDGKVSGQDYLIWVDSYGG